VDTTAQPETTAAPLAPRPVLPMIAIGGLIALLIALTAFAGPVNRALNATAAQLFAPAPYIELVLNTPGKVIKKDTHAEEDDHDAAAEATGEEH
jgi:multicomponent K+:H+ antiporter subunit D